MTNIVFVDIDGPLLPGKMHMFKENRTREKFATPMFDPWAVRCFNVWTKYADAKAVLSTNWVWHWEVDQLIRVMEENGLELNWHEQPVTPKRFSSGTRFHEILNWLEDNTDIEDDRFIAVDDDTSCAHIRNIIDEGHRDIYVAGDWIAVDYANGISMQNFEDGCKHLGIDIDDVKEGEFGIKKLTDEEKEQRQKDLEILSWCI